MHVIIIFILKKVLYIYIYIKRNFYLFCFVYKYLFYSGKIISLTYLTQMSNNNNLTLLTFLDYFHLFVNRN